VMVLKIFCSPAIFQGMFPCRPITRFLAMAAINEIRMGASPPYLYQSSLQRCRVRRDYFFLVAFKGSVIL
jgi:hypothetical protein